MTYGGFSTAQVALLLVALQFAVFAAGWGVAARLLPDDQPAARWWGLFATANALGVLMIVLGMRDGNEPLRAAGNVLLIAGAMALQRGLWVFIDRRPANAVQGVVLAVEVVIAWLGMSPAWAPLRIGLGSALWAWLYLWAACDLYGHARRQWRQLHAVLFAVPMVFTALMIAARAVRAVLSPATVLHEVNTDTMLSLGSSVSALVAALALQLMLVGLVIVRLVSRLHRLSRHDPLTGLLNRRAMDEVLGAEAQRARRLAGVMAVLMVDIDHFKRLNDSRGHAAGDRALQHLAAVLSAQMREIDQLARWGGEEFVALLPGTDGDAALAVAERLCERVRSTPLLFDDQPLPLTATIGVAQWLGQGDTPADLLARADEALYRGKRSGRDQANLADPPLRAAA